MGQRNLIICDEFETQLICEDLVLYRIVVPRKTGF